MYTVRSERCPANHPCPTVSYCPTGAITQRNFHSVPTVNDEKCTGCGLCSRVCPAFVPAG